MPVDDMVLIVLPSFPVGLRARGAGLGGADRVVGGRVGEAGRVGDTGRGGRCLALAPNVFPERDGPGSERNCRFINRMLVAFNLNDNLNFFFFFLLILRNYIQSSILCDVQGFPSFQKLNVYLSIITKSNIVLNNIYFEEKLIFFVNHIT